MMTQIEPPSESVSVGPVSAERSFNWAKFVFVAAGLAGVALVVLSIVKVPFFSQSPGSATPLEDLIEIEGADEFPSEGEVLFTTVRLTGELSVLEWVAAKFDDAVVIRPRDEVLGTQTRDEQREQNLSLMSESQELAKRVALDYLGYDVIQESGALITQIQEDSGAVGIIEPFDVLVSAGGVQLFDGDDLVGQIELREPGDVLSIVIRRFDATGETTDIDDEVVLGARDDGSALMGVGVQTAFELTELPVDIEIDTARVGGPSAGLALSLSVLDLLTEGELTGGVQVATTGTIDILGNIGPIGGVAQKTHAVRRAGIDLFLVPAADFDVAQAAAGDDLEVVAVATFDEAVEVLAARGGNGLSLRDSVDAT